MSDDLEKACGDRDAHCGHLRVCHCDDDADVGGAKRTSILKAIGP